MPPFHQHRGHWRIALRVTPKAGRNALGGVVADGQGQQRLRVLVTAPADQGKANQAVLKLLAKTWRLPASCLRIVQGETARDKLVEIGEDSAAAAQWRDRLERMTGDQA